MLTWIILFVIVVFISFVLAFRSMVDYQEKPFNLAIQYSVYLIKNQYGLTEDVLKNLHRDTVKDNFILSFERLLKGDKSALVVFGPKTVLKSFVDILGLVELEEYSKKQPAAFGAWEIGSKSTNLVLENNLKIILPDLKNSEELWWQVVIQPQKDKKADFKATIRSVLLAEDQKRVQELQSAISKFDPSTNLVTLPQLYSSAQVLQFYQDRSLPVGGSDREKVVFNFSESDILKVLGL